MTLGVGASLQSDANTMGDFDKGGNTKGAIMAGSIVTESGLAGLVPSIIELRWAKRDITDQQHPRLAAALRE